MNWWSSESNDWWTGDANLSWLGSVTTWWIVGPLLVVALLWAAMKISQRTGALQRQLHAGPELEAEPSLSPA